MSKLVASTRKPVRPAAEKKSAGPIGGAAGMVDLRFNMETQKQTQWCWAAVSVSTSKHFDSLSSWTQCKMVNGELGQTTCCSAGSSESCNQPWYLDLALTRTNNLSGAATQDALTLAKIKAEINAKRPVGVRIGWSGGGGHFVIIDGYNSATKEISVRDPFYGSSVYSLTAFKTKYQSTGAWSHTYKTKA